MKSITASQAIRGFDKLLLSLENGCGPYLIRSKKHRSILLSESDWRGIEDTIYLISIPGMRKSIKERLKTQLSGTKKHLSFTINNRRGNS